MRIFAAICLCVTALASTANAASSLELIQKSDSSQAVVLVGGINDNYGYFQPWMSDLRQTQSAVYGFEHDHHVGTMQVGAQALADELLRLSDSGVESVTILAHSMGGLVAKKALHLLGPDGTSRFLKVELRTYGTPWGGFFAANFARWLPGSQFVSNLLGFPMGPEIGSSSEFMLSLRAPLASNVKFVVFDSTYDTVATPNSDSAIEQYQGVLAQATTVTRLSHVGHTGFVNALDFSM